MENIFLLNLGCAKNLVDSEIMLGFLEKEGFRQTHYPERADLAIVNSCAFIQEAKQESIDAIFDLVKLKNKGRLKKIIVAGCLPSRYNVRLSRLLPEVDAFLGPGDIDKICQIIRASLSGQNLFLAGAGHYLYSPRTPRKMQTPRHYAYVKIADGCNNRCSYCVIPKIRGDYKSRPMESIVKEAVFLAERGVKEINLISQDTTFYGYDCYGDYKLEVLLKKLVKIKKLRWIRILYTHPRHLTKNILDIISREPKICNYIDLPIQHISGNILKLMRRRVTTCFIKRLIDEVRQSIPNVALRSTLIVGFPQEEERDFRELYDFVRKIRFERLGLFKYSQEEDTAAAALVKQVPDKVKESRYRKIMLLQQKISQQINRSFIGKDMEVMIEKSDRHGLALARSRYDAPDIDQLVYVKGRNLKAGDLIGVRISGASSYDLLGERI
ncbi:MAG: 30S ribosomal protein S12 methylthiotransferase RimO [Candidatus Omnitrophica bacterium]|nr:30S ribosomal protein S12 methylthiotransferase RimO [Candidatus Omnitrophota bacterium]MBU1925328.1 30S ribosomal protein S12 methylthiotransferase RimO [Candidatus Omnitrophota bacterium]